MQLVCTECQRESEEDAEGWHAYLGTGDHGDLEALAFCPECAERALGGHAVPEDDKS
jgi:hypothetical protein